LYSVCSGFFVFKETVLLKFGLNQERGSRKVLSYYGPLVTFLDSVVNFNYTISKDLLPKGSSESNFLKSIPLTEDRVDQLSAHRPDVFVVLNESTFDPFIVNSSVEINEDLNFFKKSKYLFAHRPLRVQTFGGKTYKSEFSFLTGLSINDLPNSGILLPS
jgi:hypothetical protein